MSKAKDLQSASDEVENDTNLDDDYDDYYDDWNNDDDWETWQFDQILADVESGTTPVTPDLIDEAKDRNRLHDLLTAIGLRKANKL